MSDVILGPHVELLMPEPKQEQGRPAGAQCIGWWQVVIVAFMCVSSTLHVFQHLELQRLNLHVAKLDRSQDEESVFLKVCPYNHR